MCEVLVNAAVLRLLPLLLAQDIHLAAVQAGKQSWWHGFEALAIAKHPMSCTLNARTIGTATQVLYQALIKRQKQATGASRQPGFH